MARGIRRQAPALLIAFAALLVALGGTVYAAAKIDGKSIKPKSLPGNRLAPGSVPGDRLKAGTVGGDRLVPDSVTAAQLDLGAIGQVPSAAHADSADSAREAQTALNAVNALDATRVNGHSAGCVPPARLFAGACWQTVADEAALTAPAAALACANRGGELPEALALVAFSQQPGIALAATDEWTSDIPVISGLDVYSVITVSASGKITSAASTASKRFRCVIPLVS